MNSAKVRLVTRTAVLLALTVVFQVAGRYLTPFMGPNSNFVVGPLVNASLLVAAATVGLWGAGIIAVAAPFGALLTGAAVPLPFLPFVAVGNLLLVLVFCLLKKNRLAGIGAGALVKFGFLFGAVVLFLRLVKVPPKLAGVLFFSFSWPQLVTALLGGVLAMVVIKALGKSLEI